MQHDNKIMELKSQIESKRAKLKDLQPFRPITSCMITYIYDSKKNINVMNIDDLKMLAIRLHSDIKVQSELGFSETKTDGFVLEDWKTDVISKIEEKESKSELKKLASLEKELENLLSSDKKTELAIDKISAELLA